MIIEIKEVSKKFNNDYILTNVNMTFESGKIYAFVGRNGTGKSVLLRMICAFYKPTSGQILFDGENYISKKGIPKNTRALIENPEFISTLSGFDNLKLLSKILNIIDDKQIHETLKKVNLFDDANKLYGNYSLGMRQKLGIAQVLMENPEVIILDEPFNGVDVESIEKIKQVLLELKNSNKIIIIATHVKKDIEQLVDVEYKFENGNVTAL